ncbi:MAG: recombination mediator RecR [Bacteroidales bacterium]|jgi:recombination protein RecR|nr:recombination mediator RecR [Bacteroidales bacterium]
MDFDGKSSKLLEEAIIQFSSLPGIGKKTALRFALHLLKKNENEVETFATTILKMKTETRFCKICNNISDNDICSICEDKTRNKELICVVEGIHDVMAIESTSQYNGTYHVLGGIISPMEGIGPADLSILPLIERTKSEKISEIILALPTTMEGDTTNYYISRKIINPDIEITTLARGVAIGDELQYTDEITLGQSILHRKPFTVKS